MPGRLYGSMDAFTICSVQIRKWPCRGGNRTLPRPMNGTRSIDPLSPHLPVPGALLIIHVMRHETYMTHGTCSRQIDFDLDDNGCIHNLSFTGGCNGNLKGIGRLCEGMKAEDVASRVEGTRCGLKSTSCPDQLAKAIREALNA